jgi:hypothetical protein
MSKLQATFLLRKNYEVKFEFHESLGLYDSNEFVTG